MTTTMAPDFSEAVVVVGDVVVGTRQPWWPGCADAWWPGRHCSLSTLMSSHDMSTYGEQRKAWAREWARLRREYLDGEAPARQNSHPDPGSPIPANTKLATIAGRNHMRTYISDDERAALVRTD
mgnify:CR=1 FL=1